MIRLHWPHTEIIPPCIIGVEERNPAKREDLMLWALGRCNLNERLKMYRAWLLGGSFESPEQAYEIALIAGLMPKEECDG